MASAPDHLRAQQRQMPQQPGVYRFLDEKDRPLYIGKAKSLRHRIGSHLSNPSTRGGQRLLELTARIDFILCDSEWEALLLEQELVRSQQPTYNVALRHGRHYPRIGISLDEEFPRIYLAREDPVPARRYFGPYEASEAREILRALTRLYRFRSCEGTKPGRATGSPCLDYHIGRCDAPCVGYISQEDYGNYVRAAIDILSGRWSEPAAQLEERMRQAAAEQRFEDAAKLRDEWQRLQQLRGRDTTPLAVSRDCDVWGLACESGKAQAAVLQVRSGALAGRDLLALERTEFADTAQLLRECLLGFYASSDPPALVVCEAEVADAQLVTRLLSQRRGSKVELRVPQRGPLRRLLDLAARNAASALSTASTRERAPRPVAPTPDKKKRAD